MYETTQQFRVADGGVWDNSGLGTLTDLYDHVVKARRRNNGASIPRLILISVNAETGTFNRRLAKDFSEERGFLDKQPLRIWPIPIRIGALGFESIDLIHFTNKRRAEQIAIKKISDLLKNLSEKDKGKSPSMYYFPVNLTQLSEQDQHTIRGQGKLFERIQEITTDYSLAPGDATTLGEAATALITTPQDEGWLVGPACLGNGKMTEVKRLDDAVAYALIRSQLVNGWPPENDKWLDPLNEFFCDGQMLRTTASLRGDGSD